jgi:heme-degrading monooxygenase HmoA
MTSLAETLEAPYYTATFATGSGLFAQRDADAAGRLIVLATRAPGFLGLESAARAEGTATVSYWETLDAVEAWKARCDQALSKTHGLKSWYLSFGLSIARIERHPLFKWIKRAA